jgi:ABC-2 type transport system ATP-binding protein
MDEPTLYLDVFARRDFHKLMHNLTQVFKIGFLYSTHELEQLPQHADRVLAIQEGTLKSFTNSEWTGFGSEAFLNSR